MSDISETPVADLIADDRCQARECMNWDAVGDYRAAYEAGKPLPPLEVFGVRGKLVIVDGFHRCEAAIRAGVATLPVTMVGEGAMRDAIWEALGKNHHHGVQRTQADKRKAVRKALARDDGMSDRAIANHCGVSHTFVANMRKSKVEQLGLELTMPEPDTAERRPDDREAAIEPLERLRDASVWALVEAMEHVIRCKAELGARLADLETKLPRDVYKAFLANPHAFVEQCEQRIAELEAAE